MTDADIQPFSYDTVPYPTHPYTQTHPDRLYTIARLFDVPARPINRCRVLEIGCAQGGNIIPMAEQLPGSEFVGIDRSAVQIRRARELADAVGLNNLDLQQRDILAIEAGLGEFDYILCHGVWSWVPDAVQERLLKICATNLAPHGVAYISYNTYPGWHIRGMIRSMMCYHARRFATPSEQTPQARALLDFLAGAAAGEESTYGRLLRDELDLLRKQSDAYLYHDHLEKVNEPIYFHQFAGRATSAGLQYLGEARMAAMYTGNLPAETEKILRSVATDLIQMEQYMDFVRNRQFRQTLLVHKEVTVNRRVRPTSLADMYVASPMQFDPPNADPRSADPATLRHRKDQRSITTASHLTKAAFAHLADVWPSSVAFADLVHQARTRLELGPVAGADEIARATAALGQSLLKCYLVDLVEVHSRPSDFVLTASKRPHADATARAQAKTGPIVTNRRHESVRLDSFARQLIGHLDGTRSNEDLLTLLQAAITRGDLNVQVTDRDIVTQLSQTLNESLHLLASSALLIG